MTNLEEVNERQDRMEKFYRDHHESLVFRIPPMQISDYLVAYTEKKYGKKNVDDHIEFYGAYKAPALYTDRLLSAFRGKIMFHAPPEPSPFGQSSSFMTFVIQVDSEIDLHAQAAVAIEDLSDGFEILAQVTFLAKNGSDFIKGLDLLSPYRREPLANKIAGFMN